MWKQNIIFTATSYVKISRESKVLASVAQQVLNNISLQKQDWIFQIIFSNKGFTRVNISIRTRKKITDCLSPDFQLLNKIYFSIYLILVYLLLN